jgi:hypothetical protein
MVDHASDIGVCECHERSLSRFFKSSSSRALDNADATSPVGTATIPKPMISTNVVKIFPPVVTG